MDGLRLVVFVLDHAKNINGAHCQTLAFHSPKHKFDFGLVNLGWNPFGDGRGAASVEVRPQTAIGIQHQVSKNVRSEYDVAERQKEGQALWIVQSTRSISVPDSLFGMNVVEEFVSVLGIQIRPRSHPVLPFISLSRIWKLLDDIIPSVLQ